MLSRLEEVNQKPKMRASWKLTLICLAFILLQQAHAICFNDTNVIVLGNGAGSKGDKGEKGDTGLSCPSCTSNQSKGEKGDPGLPGQSCNCLGKGIDNDFLIHLLNDYYVSESGYYKNLYRVTSKALTDGRSDTGGYGSKSSSAGNWLQATYIRPVYVTSVQIAGGYIPAWGHSRSGAYGDFYLQYSTDNLKWVTVRMLPKQAGIPIMSYSLSKPITAQYWRLTSINNWIATTEFSLKPLTKPQ